VGLTDDQKAMLRLLAQREEGYDDMAALMGISVEEVRERVKEALAEVEEPSVVAKEPEAPAPPPAPTPTPPPAPEPPPAEAAPVAAEPPAAPAPPSGQSSPKSSTGAKRSAQIPSLKMPKDRGALIGLGAGALVVVALVIVLIVGGDGGGDSSSTASEGSPNQNARALAANKNLTQAVLSADDGSDADGQAIFGRFKKKVLLQVTGEGLEPSADGESYAVWLSHTGKAMVPVGTAKVEDSGELAARFEVPAAVLVLVARAAFDQIEVTRTSDRQLNAAIAKARKTESESSYTGTPVLSGKITGPLVGAGGK
jgi:hypothetical protein